MIPRPPRSTPFPYSTLFRSVVVGRRALEQHGSAVVADRPQLRDLVGGQGRRLRHGRELRPLGLDGPADRKSTRLNSSHANISYAVFCLKKIYMNKNKSQSLT